jgi:putative ABC transport system permease protein
MSRARSSTLISENLRIALDVLVTHKMRSGLIILGVTIGVASLMGMISILLGLYDKILQDVSSSEQTVLILTKFDFLVSGFDESLFRRKDITPEDADALRKQCPSLQTVGYIVQTQGRPSYTLRAGDERSRSIEVVGSEPSLFQIWSLDLESGRMFGEEELFHRSKVIVLGHSPRRDLFPNRDPIGKKVRINGDDFTVVGTFEERKSLFGSLGENFAIIPYTTYMASLWKERDLQRAFGVVRPGVSEDAAKDEVIRVMRGRHRLKANEDNDFDVTSTDAALEFLGRITAPVAAILAAISSIGLLVGGIGVMNMMLVSVTERTGEIGVRKAMGATRQDILWQFLMEAGTLTGIGGILGICLGFTAALGVSALTGLPSHLSVLFIVGAAIFSVAIGVFFGLYPATRAARLDPVQAMSYAK